MRKKRGWLLLLCLLVAFLPVVFTPQTVKADLYYSETEEDGYEYKKSVYMRKKEVRAVSVETGMTSIARDMIKPRMKVKIKSDSKYLKVKYDQSLRPSDRWVNPLYGGCYFVIYAKKDGIYHISYDVYLKDKCDNRQERVTLKTTVYVGNKYVDDNFIDSISIGGVKLEELEDGYFSEKYQGKIKITPGKHYKVLKINNKGKGQDKYERTHYFLGGKTATVKNGEKITLNHIAQGANQGTVEELGAGWENRDDMITEYYDLPVARTQLSVLVENKITHKRNWCGIKIYTPAIEKK